MSGSANGNGCACAGVLVTARRLQQPFGGNIII